MIEYRKAEVGDSEGIVKLFSEDGNPYNWDLKRWNHYYRDYPEGTPIAFVAVSEHKVIGHYGMLPVKIGSFRAMLGLHALVSKQKRGMEVIGRLLKCCDEWCITHKIDLICAFSNPNFSLVTTRFFGWKEIGNLEFVDCEKIDYRSYMARLRFTYSEKWQDWRFGEKKECFISRYSKDGKDTYQILKNFSKENLKSDDFSVEVLQCWHPTSYHKKRIKGQFTQPFCVKVYNADVSNEVLDINNWFIEMGDSDTFVYSPLK